MSMKWHSIESSNLRMIAYSRKLKMLQVEFINGTVYRYLKVPYFHYLNLLRKKGGSHGAYFSKYIRDSYESCQIAPDAPEVPDVNQQLKDSLKSLSKEPPDAA